MSFPRDMAIVGGCGHVGLPLGIAFAESGLDVALYDTNEAVVAQVGRGEMPFKEADADEPLRFVDFAAPVYDAEGALRGVVATHLYWTWVQAVVERGLPELLAGLEAYRAAATRPFRPGPRIAIPAAAACAGSGCGSAGPRDRR